MKEKNKVIWAYLSMKKDASENDYDFYEDGIILHHYDLTIIKLDIEMYVSFSDILDSEKDEIISECEEKCSHNVVEQIKRVLITNK